MVTRGVTSPKQGRRWPPRPRNPVSGLDITPHLPAGRQLIEGYGGGAFRIASIRHQGSVLVFPTLTQSWSAVCAEDISLDSLSALPALTEDNPADILIVGCGEVFLPPPAGLKDGLREWGLVLEWMDTGAACRTFNVLLAEERAVAAALIAVD